MIPYTKHTISKADIDAIVRVLKSDRLTQGSQVEEFEKTISDYCGSRYAVVFNSGTSALHGATFAAGINPGDEVITTPLSFVASANCILYQNGTPVFADIDYMTGLLDPIAVESKITERTRAVITVDYGGLPSFLRELKDLCAKRNLFLINDASHSFGASYFDKRIGTQADITVFSFHPAKAITTAEGGAIVTNNKKIYDKAILFRTHGITKLQKDFINKQYKSYPWYSEMQHLGYNYRLSDIHSALGVSQIKRVDKFINAREAIAEYYTSKLANDSRFGLPVERKGSKSAWHLYPLRLLEPKIDKKRLFRKFKNRNIFPQVHFIPIHTHPYYQDRFSYKWGDFPKAERFYEEEVSLPLYPTLKKKEAEEVISILKHI